MKIFIINLAKSADRLKAQHEQFNHLGLEFERLAAVEVAQISDEFYQKNITKGQRLMKQSEFACLLSHQKAWQQVLIENRPCVILEDDAVLVKDFADLIHEIEHSDIQADLINLEVHGRKKIVGLANKQLLNEEYHLLPLLLDKSGTGGYILYPNGAKKLLNRLNHTMTLADDFIYNCPHLDKYQLEPAALLQSDKCEQYGVNFDAYPLNSLIGSIKNTVDIQLTTTQKIILKKNRIWTQLTLGLKTLAALSKGKKREIGIDINKFN